MEHFLTKLFYEADERLLGISLSEMSELEKAREAILFLEAKVTGLKEFILTYTFKDENEEISFFKQVKPKIVSRLIFNRDVFGLELARPAGSDEIQVNYLKGELNWINEFFLRNIDFYRYYRSGGTHLDRSYFLRGAEEMRICRDDHPYERDPRFATYGDHKVARMQANELLQEYLKIEILKLTLPQGCEATTGMPEELKWTGRKTDLIEQLYAWDTEGCFNDGKLSLAQLTAYIAKRFGIEMGNVTCNFYDMKVRNTPTPFLDRLKNRLLERMGRGKHQAHESITR